MLRKPANGYYYPAKTLIGDDGVKRAFDPANASPINLFSNKKVSGYDLDGKGGWTLQAVSEIAGSLNVKKLNNVEIQFGNTWLAEPFGEGDLHQFVSKNSDLTEEAKTALRKNQFAVVQRVVYTNSIRYTFKQQDDKGVSADYKLGYQEIAALQAKGYSVTNGGVEVKGLRFIAYTPLPGVAGDLKR